MSRCPRRMSARHTFRTIASSAVIPRGSMDGCYSKSYVEAHEKFVGAGRETGADMSRYVLDRPGPNGEELSTDVAWSGSHESNRVLVTISATHGVEGFFGSATQIEWLRRGEAARLPAGVAALHIHAL